MALTAEIISLIVLLMLSAFFSASEAALLSISRLKVRHMIYKKQKNALILKKLKDDPDRLLSTILIGNNLVNTAASVLATSIAYEIFSSSEFAITTGVMTFLLLVFGDVTPKSLALRHKESLALKVVKPIWALSIIFHPIINLLRLILKLFGPAKKKPLVTQEELKSFIYTGIEEGAIKEDESRMIQKIFELSNVDARKVMTSKKDVFMVESNKKIAEIINMTIKKQYSRIPVYEKSNDNIVGIVYIKDILKQLKLGKTGIEIKQIMRKPFFVFGTKKINSLLKEFQKRNLHMALVIDNKGLCIGLVTIEDILEEIVGEITDESDTEDLQDVKNHRS